MIPRLIPEKDCSRIQTDTDKAGKLGTEISHLSFKTQIANPPSEKT